MRSFCPGILGVLLVCPFSAAETITTESLLGEMTDLERLARMPAPAYTCKQFSSWDRESTGPQDLATWFANRDAGQFLRVEEKDGRKEWVMADVDGPGAIVRIWSANPTGTVRIYLDGGDKPAIECPMEELLGGKFPGLTARSISGEYSRGWNLYFPIPYARHMKATCDQEKFYYHINYRTYAPGTDVQTFTLAELKRLSDRIDQTAAALAAPKAAAEPPAGSKVHEYAVELAADEEKPLVELTGSSAIAGFRIQPSAGNLPAAVRGVVLAMEFDGEKTVECPIGDFFGMAPGLIPYESLPVGVREPPNLYGWSHWRLPFRRSAVVRARNWSGQPVSLKGVFAVTDWTWDDRSLLFHAKWRIQRGIPTRPFSDWTHLECEGSGRFVGGHLHYINAVKGWWGEGDEKIFVDGEAFPSTFGTGTEDYYGYAWGNPQRFVHAYHNQPHVDGPGTYGNVSNNRWHIIDDIPFTKSFKFDLEQWQWAENVKATRAAVSYWYARPGGKDFFKPITKEDVKYDAVPAYQVKHVAGAIEGESLTPVEKTAGNVKKQGLGEQFSGEEMLRWDASGPGDRLTLAFDAPQAGRRQVMVHLVRAGDFGQVQLHLNGEKVGEVIDLYVQRGTQGVKIELGKVDLKASGNQLTIEVVGSNPGAKGKHSVGLDYILVQ